MANTNKIFLGMLLSLVLASIVVVNIRGGLLSYYGFYYDKEKARGNRLFNSLDFVEDCRPYSLFLSYTGLETGYGFFAPNVASDFVLEFDCIDSTGKKSSASTSCLLKTKEASLRLNTACSMFMYYVRPDSTSPDKDKCRIFLKGLCLRLLEANRDISSVTARVYLYHHPFLKDMEDHNSRKPSYILYATETYNREIIGCW
jgi:hypothetical protein